MAEQAKEQEVPPKSKKKLFIIIGAAVGALVVIGVAASLFMGKGSKKEAKQGAKQEATAPAAAESGSGGEGQAGAASVYSLEPFVVNIYDGQELRYLRIKVEFQMSGPDVKPLLDGNLAQLRDAILVLLTTKTLQEIQDLQGKEQLKQQILAAVDKIVPPGKVLKVYFTDFVVQ